MGKSTKKSTRGDAASALPLTTKSATNQGKRGEAKTHKKDSKKEESGSSDDTDSEEQKANADPAVAPPSKSATKKVKRGAEAVMEKQTSVKKQKRDARTEQAAEKQIEAKRQKKISKREESSASEDAGSSESEEQKADAAAAVAPPTKSATKKGKRDAEVAAQRQASAKKQKRDSGTEQAVEKQKIEGEGWNRSAKLWYRVRDSIDERTFNAEVRWFEEGEDWMQVTIEVYQKKKHAERVMMQLQKVHNQHIANVLYMDVGRDCTFLTFERFNNNFKDWLQQQEKRLWVYGDGSRVASMTVEYRSAFRGIFDGLRSLHYQNLFHGHLLEGVTISDRHHVKLVKIDRRQSMTTT